MSPSPVLPPASQRVRHNKSLRASASVVIQRLPSLPRSRPYVSQKPRSCTPVRSSWSNFRLHPPKRSVADSSERMRGMVAAAQRSRFRVHSRLLRSPMRLARHAYISSHTLTHHTSHDISFSWLYGIPYSYNYCNIDSLREFHLYLHTY